MNDTLIFLTSDLSNNYRIKTKQIFISFYIEFIKRSFEPIKPEKKLHEDINNGTLTRM